MRRHFLKLLAFLPFGVTKGQPSPTLAPKDEVKTYEELLKLKYEYQDKLNDLKLEQAIALAMAQKNNPNFHEEIKIMGEEERARFLASNPYGSEHIQ